MQISDPNILGTQSVSEPTTPLSPYIKPTIQVQRTRRDAKLPTKAHDTDMGWDIYCVKDELWLDKCLFSDGKEGPCFELMPGESHTFKTGIKMTAGDTFGFLLRERSGLGIKDIAVRAGVIDAGYRGEWMIHLINLGKKPHFIKEGDRIAQAILTEIIPADIVEVEELTETERGEKGFHSSGR